MGFQTVGGLTLSINEEITKGNKAFQGSQHPTSLPPLRYRGISTGNFIRGENI